METMKSNYTVFLSDKNFKEMEKDDDYLVLASKECAYTQDPYVVVEFQILTEDPEDYDPEGILNALGGLALHEDGSNCFCMLETDIPELENSFGWDGAADILMAELLTVSDKLLLLQKKQKSKAGNGPIWLNVGTRENAIWRPIENASQELFEDKTFHYRFGDISYPTVEIWWPFLLKDIGGFYWAIKGDEPVPEEYEQEKFLFPLIKHPNPFNHEDDDLFQDPEDYNYMRRFGGA